VQVPSQTAGFQIEMQQIANALQQAQNANNVGAQQSLLGRQMRLDRRAIGLDQAKVRRIVQQLRGAISRARRSALLQDKLQLLQDIGTLRNDIGSAMSQLQSVASGGGSGTFDLAPGGAAIKAPTPYDVRHSMLPGRMAAIHARRPGRNEVHHHHHHGHTTVKVDVHNAADAGKVYDAIDRALGSQVHARMRSAGIRGT
jgi:hypothetical protein